MWRPTRQLLNQCGPLVLAVALLVTQAAGVSHGHPPVSDAAQASDYLLVLGADNPSGNVGGDGHGHDTVSDIECLLCLAADLTPLHALSISVPKDLLVALPVASSVEAPTLLESILAYQTRAPPLSTIV